MDHLRIVALTIVAAASLVTMPAAQGREPFMPSSSPPEFADVDSCSLYVPMKDGVRVAVDVLLPTGLRAGRRIPAILKITRYNRAAADGSIHRLDRFFVAHGYARVLVDERGTGASFGSVQYGRATLDDLRTVVDWVVAQPWSNERVGAIGNSYEGTTAELLAASGHPAVRAVVPRFSDFDYYRQLFLPGGVRNEWFVKAAGQFINALDRGAGAKRVDSDRDGALLKQALAERRNVDYLQALNSVVDADDVPPGLNVSVEQMSNASLKSELEKARVPMLVWAGWMDAGTAQGALERFRALRVPQRVIIGAWNHAATHDANPLRAPETPAEPAESLQYEESLRFFDRYLKSQGDTTPEHRIHYYTMGEERWKSSSEWPIRDLVAARWWLESNGQLTFVRPWGTTSRDSVAAATLTAASSSGTQTRWHTQLGGGDVVYSGELATSSNALHFTSEPITSPLEITGSPVLALNVMTSHADPTLFAYLSALLPSGDIRHITDGQFRALHRHGAPHPSFRRVNGSFTVPGEPFDISILLWPTSIRLPAGTRMRVTLTAADRDIFGLPSHGDTLQLRVQRGSRLQLPVTREP